MFYLQHVNMHFLHTAIIELLLYEYLIRNTYFRKVYVSIFMLYFIIETEFLLQII